MSRAQIAAALEIKLASILPAIDTVAENTVYKPITGRPYQENFVLFAQPENPTFGDGFFRQRGIFQVSLYYPTGVGRGDALERADLLSATFPRGLSIDFEGITTTVEKTPEIGPGSIDGDRYVIVVRIRFYSNIAQ